MYSKPNRTSWLLMFTIGCCLAGMNPIAWGIDNHGGVNPLLDYNPATQTHAAYFGFGWYNIGLTFETSELTEIAASNSRTILITEVGDIGDPVQFTPSIIAKFDQAQSLGLEIMVGLSRYSGYLEGVEPNDPGTYQPLSGWVNLVKNHPALLAWMIGDENDLYPLTLQDVLDTAQVIHALDPGHQVVQNFSGFASSQSTVLSYMNGTDVLAMDYYAEYNWTPEFGGSGTYLEKAHAFADTAATNGFSYVQMVQGFGPDLGGLSDQRFPTAAEYRWNVFAALASAGARGIINFTYANSPGWYSDPSAFPSFRDNVVAPVFGELKEIQHAMETGYNVGAVNLSWSEPGWSAVYNRISQLLLYDEQMNQYYLILTNNGGDSKEVTVTVSNLPVAIPNLNVRVSKTEETIAVTDQGGGSYQFIDTLGNHEVILYAFGDFAAEAEPPILGVTPDTHSVDCSAGTTTFNVQNNGSSLALNPGFEEPGSDAGLHWLVQTFGGNWTYDQNNSSAAWEGQDSVLVDPNAGGIMIYQNIVIPAAGDYIWSTYVKNEGAGTTSVGLWLFGGDGPTDDITPFEITAGSGWQEISKPISLTAGIHECRLFAWSSTTSHAVRWDAAQMALASASMNWTATVIEGGSWLSIISGSSGAGNGTISVSFTENTANSPRTGIIRVTAPGATGSPKDVTVTQGRNPALPLVPGQEILKGFSYGPWGVPIPGQTYIDVFNDRPLEPRPPEPSTWRERIYANTEGIYAIQGLAMGDLENSGTNKVWKATKVNSYIVLSESDYVWGAGELTNEHNKWSSLNPANYDTRGIAIGDADNDGTPELIWAQRAGNIEQVVAYTWDGTHFSYKGTLLSASDGSRCHGVSVGDADNDGVNDVVLAWGGAEGPVTIYKAHWDGMTFSWGDTIRAWSETGYKVLTVAVGDPDNDNVNEVMISFGWPSAYWVVDSLKWNGASWDTTRDFTDLWMGGQGYYIIALAIGNADNLCYYDADFNKDHYVNFTDLATFASNWLRCDCSTSSGWCGGVDMNQDERVNWSDFSVLAGSWLKCTDPQDENCDSTCP